MREYPLDCVGRITLGLGTNGVTQSSQCITCIDTCCGVAGPLGDPRANDWQLIGILLPPPPLTHNYLIGSGHAQSLFALSCRCRPNWVGTVEGRKKGRNMSLTRGIMTLMTRDDRN